MLAVKPLPRLPGVFGLSKNEIKKDMREMMRDVIYDDDTDSSVKSDDILTSTYPVKPRKTPRRDRSLGSSMCASDAYEPNGPTTQVDVDEALRYIQSTEQKRPDLVAIDALREEREVQRLSLLDTLSRQTKDFSIEKKQHENYLRLLQSLQARALQLRNVYIQRNLVLMDAHSANARRVEAVKSLKSECAAGETNVLRVTLTPSQRVLAFYKGQYLHTPMGEGLITKIVAASQTLHIQLPFGVLFASASAAVEWHATLPSGADALADDFLLSKWTCRQDVYNVPVDYHSRLRSLIQALEGEEGATDGDEADAGDTDEAADAAAETPAPVDEDADDNEDVVHRLSYILHKSISTVTPKLFPYVFCPPPALPFVAQQLEYSAPLHNVFSRECAPEVLHYVEDPDEMIEMTA